MPSLLERIEAAQTALPADVYDLLRECAEALRRMEGGIVERTVERDSAEVSHRDLLAENERLRKALREIGGPKPIRDAGFVARLALSHDA